MKYTERNTAKRHTIDYESHQKIIFHRQNPIYSLFSGSTLAARPSISAANARA
jgi:DNA-binding FadR family transcriptional regulator